MAKYPKKKARAKVKRTRSKKKPTVFQAPPFMAQYQDWDGTKALRDFCSSTHGPLDFEDSSQTPVIQNWGQCCVCRPTDTKGCYCEFHFMEIEPQLSLNPPPGTMLNPADTTPFLGKQVGYNGYNGYKFKYAITYPTKYRPLRLTDTFECTRWSRFKVWFRRIFID